MISLEQIAPVFAKDFQIYLNLEKIQMVVDELSEDVDAIWEFSDHLKHKFDLMANSLIMIANVSRNLISAVRS